MKARLTRGIRLPRNTVFRFMAGWGVDELATKIFWQATPEDVSAPDFERARAELVRRIEDAIRRSARKARKR